MNSQNRPMWIIDAKTLTPFTNTPSIFLIRRSREQEGNSSELLITLFMLFFHTLPKWFMSSAQSGENFRVRERESFTDDEPGSHFAVY